MEIASIFFLLLAGGLLYVYKNTRTNSSYKAECQIEIDEFQKQIETALTLPRESDDAWQNEPATETMLQELDERGIRLNQPLTKGQALNVLGLFSPPDGRQVDILKHFNIPYSFKMNQTLAHYLIRELFSDPQKIEEWNNRPPTTTVRQGLLFMEGKLISGLSHVECQSRLDRIGKDNPNLYQEWKQIDRLFLESNHPEIRAKSDVRKITWKRFFESYTALKESGINPRAMNGEDIIEHTIRHDKTDIANEQIRQAMQPASS
jgi:hypothetical protein